MFVDIPGVEVTGRTTFLLTNEEGIFDWTEYGFRLTVPPDSLPVGVDQCQLDIIASTAGLYQLPENHYLVSGVFWIRPSIPCLFKQQLSMSIEHCATITSSTKLSFVRTQCSQETRPFVFKPIEIEYCSFSKQEGFVNVNHFSGYGVTGQGADLCSSRKYGAVLYYYPWDRVSFSTNIHLVVLWNTKVHCQV